MIYLPGINGKDTLVLKNGYFSIFEVHTMKAFWENEVQHQSCPGKVFSIM